MVNFKSILMKEDADELRMKRAREDVEVKLNAFLVASDSLSEAISKANITLAQIASSYYAEKEMLEQAIDHVETELEINNRLKYYMSELVNYR